MSLLVQIIQNCLSPNNSLRSNAEKELLNLCDQNLYQILLEFSNECLKEISYMSDEILDLTLQFDDKKREIKVTKKEIKDLKNKLRNLKNEKSEI